MSIIHLNQIKTKISNLFDTLIDTSDLRHKSGSEEFTDSLRSRSLSAYIVHHLSGASPVFAASAIVDGADDNGIDAVYWDGKEYKLYLVQSKWIKNGSGEPEAKEIGRFTKGIKDLLSLNFERFNKKILDRKAEIEEILSTSGLQIIAIFVHAGASGPSKHARSEFEDILSEINDAGEILSYRYFNQADLYKSLTEDLDKPITAEVTIRQWGKIQDPYYAIYGQVSAADLSELWKKNKDRIFAKNLRSTLGDTDVNTEIKHTLSNEPELFWYFNNGVTAIADKVEKLALGGHKHDIGHFKCEGLYIVNGAQTVSSIGTFSEKNPSKELTECNVHFRVISLEHAKSIFGDSVTKTNNRQNKIEVRDFVAQDPEQKRIRTELLIDKIHYQIMRGDDIVSGTNSFELHESTTALACASGDISNIVLLKNNIGRIWEDISKPPYKSLFNPSISGRYVWNCVQTQRFIDQQISKSSATYKKARDLRVLSAGNRAISSIAFSLIPKSALSKPDFDIEKIENDTDLTLIISFIIGEMVNHIQRFHQNSFITNLFKNQGKTRSAVETVQRIAHKEYKSELLKISSALEK